MFERLSSALRDLREVLAALDPEVLDPDSASELVQTFAEGERLCAAGKALAARQVARSGVWRKEGDRSPAKWMARKTGESVGQALGVLEVAEALEDLPQVDEAVRRGRLSQAQAKEIASAASVSPSQEKDLLEAAEEEPLSRLKDRCARVRAAAHPDEVARHEAIRKARYLRHYRDHEGAFRLEGRLTPEAGAVVLSALEPYERQEAERARKHGLKERRDALLADALVALAEDSRRTSFKGSGGSKGPRGSNGSNGSKGPPASPGAMIHVLVDHAALTRGEVGAGERCEIPGVGPIPVATARALSNDAFISALVVDGVDIKPVGHFGRNIPARLRTALRARDEGCVVPGCTETKRLEIDHIWDRIKGGPTELDNLALLCSWHHYLKTHQGYRLSGGPGSWWWEPAERRKPRRRRGPPRV